MSITCISYNHQVHLALFLPADVRQMVGGADFATRLHATVVLVRPTDVDMGRVQLQHSAARFCRSDAAHRVHDRSVHTDGAQSGAVDDTLPDCGHRFDTK